MQAAKAVQTNRCSFLIIWKYIKNQKSFAMVLSLPFSRIDAEKLNEVMFRRNVIFKLIRLYQLFVWVLYKTL